MKLDDTGVAALRIRSTQCALIVLGWDTGRRPVLGTFDPHPATPGLDRLRRTAAPATNRLRRIYEDDPHKNRFL